MCFPAQQSRKQQRLNRASPIQHALQLGTATTSYPNASTYKSYQQCLKSESKAEPRRSFDTVVKLNSLHRQLHKHLRTTPFTKVYLLAYSPPTPHTPQHTVITKQNPSTNSYNPAIPSQNAHLGTNHHFSSSITAIAQDRLVFKPSPTFQFSILELTFDALIAFSYAPNCL
jgi:hypothetical protein